MCGVPADCGRPAGAALAALDLPVEAVDLSLPEEQAAKQVYRACISTGFFYVVNHGLDEALVARLFEEIKGFFDLPTEEKARILADDNYRGWTPMEEETLDPGNQSKGDTKEGLYLGTEPSDADAHLPLHGKNQWPNPDLVPNFRPVISEYYDAAKAVTMRVLRLVALSLDLDPDYFAPYFNKAMVFLRPLHYNATPSRPDEGIYGAGAHSDYGMLTLLKTDSAPGLQICDHGKWVDVRPLHGAFIVNLGDMLERWTNGRFKSTLHRVVNQSGVERYSCPLFLDPNYDAHVQCLPTCCSDDNPPQYPPTTAGAHLLAKYTDTHAGYDFTKPPPPNKGNPLEGELSQKPALIAV